DNADGKNLRPNIVGDWRLPDTQKGKPATGGVRGIQWFNPAAFAAPARFTYGNASRTVMTGPGRVNFDTAALKNFAFSEQYRLQFRFEMFNAFNTPQFGLPGNTLGASGFGVAGAGGSNRELQFGLKLFFWKLMQPWFYYEQTYFLHTATIHAKLYCWSHVGQRQCAWRERHNPAGADRLQWPGRIRSAGMSESAEDESRRALRRRSNPA